MAINIGDGANVVTTTTGSGTAFAATVNHNDGIVVTNSTPTSSSVITYTITCAPCLAMSIVQVEVLGTSAAIGATNTTQGLYVNEVTAAAGQFTVNVKTPASLNGTVAIGFTIT
jgi:hypothetical protein